MVHRYNIEHRIRVAKDVAQFYEIIDCKYDKSKSTNCCKTGMSKCEIHVYDPFMVKIINLDKSLPRSPYVLHILSNIKLPKNAEEVFIIDKNKNKIYLSKSAKTALNNLTFLTEEQKIDVIKFEFDSKKNITTLRKNLRTLYFLFKRKKELIKSYLRVEKKIPELKEEESRIKRKWEWRTKEEEWKVTRARASDSVPGLAMYLKWVKNCSTWREWGGRECKDTCGIYPQYLGGRKGCEKARAEYLREYKIHREKISENQKQLEEAENEAKNIQNDFLKTDNIIAEKIASARKIFLGYRYGKKAPPATVHK